MHAPPPEPPSTVRALLIVGLITGFSVAARTPLLAGMEATGVALAPYLDAWALLGRDGPPSSRALGFGAALSHLPLLLHDSDGLRSVFTARLWLQALVPGLVWFAARRRGASVLAASAAALLLVAGDGLLRELMVLRPPALEWVGVAALAASFRTSRAAALLAGAAVGMATMNAWLALAAGALVLEVERRGPFVLGLVATLLPALLDARAALARGVSVQDLFALNPDLAATEVLRQLIGRLDQPSSLLLVAAPFLLVWTRRELRPAVLALALAFATSLLCGWQDEGWWRPLAPWLAAALAPAMNGSRIALLVVGSAALFAGVPDGSERGDESTLRRAGHVLNVSAALGDLAPEGPWSLLGVAQPAGDPLADLQVVVFDRTLRGPVEPLLVAGGRRLRTSPLLIHVEGDAAFATRARSSLAPGMKLVSMMPTAAVVSAPDLATATPWLDALCAGEEAPLLVDGPAAWQPFLGRGPTGPIYDCPD